MSAPAITEPEAASARPRDAAASLLLWFAAEAHRRKWQYDDSNPEAFEALHRLGNEMRAAFEATREER